MPENGGVRRKICCIFQNSFERQIGEPFELDAIAKLRKLPPQFALPELFVGRNPIHNHDCFGVRQYVKEIFEGCGKVIMCRHNSVVLGKLVALDPAPLYSRKEHRLSREKTFTMLLDEARSRRPESNNEIWSNVRVDGVKII